MQLTLRHGIKWEILTVNYISIWDIDDEIYMSWSCIWYSTMNSVFDITQWYYHSIPSASSFYVGNQNFHVLKQAMLHDSIWTTLFKACRLSLLDSEIVD